MPVKSCQLIRRVSATLRIPIWQKMPRAWHLVRGFCGSPQLSTDGVYKELTEMRIRTPWIEALKQKREEEQDPSKTLEAPATLPDQDLRPKKMSDSFTRIVCMMGLEVFSF